MKRRNFFKYILGCFAIPFLGKKAVAEEQGIVPKFPKDGKLYITVHGHYNGKIWGSNVEVEESKMTMERVEHLTDCMGGSLARCLSKNRVIAPYYDYT